MNANNKKPRLIILSDLWGKDRSLWIANYTISLQTKFNLEYYDCCELAEINTNKYFEDNLHQQFLNGGIDKTVEKLKSIEKGEIYILGFSIGGLIGWKAGLTGLNIIGFIAVSATRLRFETIKPATIIILIYGENDLYKPEDKWFKKLKLKKILLKNESHNFYQIPEISKKIADLVLKKF